MIQQDQNSQPQKESNEDKGNQESFKDKAPVKKPNEQPENPLKQQK